MDAFFIIPILVLLALLAWCVLQLKDDMEGPALRRRKATMRRRIARVG